MAKANPFRFSTKFQDDETDLLYYGYRYYNPSMGRWLSRDLIEEDGSANIYAFANNDGIGGFDPQGLKVIRLGFGFDTSARADKATIAFLLESANYLRQKLLECSKRINCDCNTPGCDCGGGATGAADVTVAANSDYNRRDKIAPSDGSYDLPTPDDPLRLGNLGKISVANATVKILITGSSIKETWLGKPIDARAATDSAGELLNLKSAVAHTVSHEIGHFAGYVGDAPGDPYHSKDPSNLMHAPGGENVDCQWCQKVSALAK